MSEIIFLSKKVEIVNVTSFTISQLISATTTVFEVTHKYRYSFSLLNILSFIKPTSNNDATSYFTFPVFHLPNFLPFLTTFSFAFYFLD